MVFSSNIFLFLFLPLFLGAYYLTPTRWKSLTILVGSYAFYAWWRVDFLLLFAAVTIWNHVIAKRIVGNENTPLAKRWMLLGVIGNLLTLGVFKYFNFGVESLNAVLTSSGMNSFEAMKFILPIGISFYIFQSISFLIDVYRKDAPPAKNFLNFAAFISLFPQLIAGPVLRYKDLAHQFEHRTHSFDLFSQGAHRFMIGFINKVLIADTVAILVDASYALENPTMADAWLGALAYTVQLYFDFSGYSHMAIGIGLMMGFRFMENFNAPYISRSITEFWKRWHISLSSWLKDYLYIPLGGNRKGKVRTYINLLLTMVLGGLWHGANWTFVLWGAWHGAILAIERALGVKGSLTAPTPFLMRAVTTSMTFFFVIIGWVMFRAENVGQAFTLYEAMFRFSDGFGLSEALSWQVNGQLMTAFIGGLTLVFVGPYVAMKFQASKLSQTATMNAVTGLGVIGLFSMAVMKLSADSFSPFLYFQF
ncbi:MAG: MBOAT family protein [Alphaproteobacteria bacterium]|nr:MBOAT family protein [Alphaproteobacteria bacterium]